MIMKIRYEDFWSMPKRQNEENCKHCGQWNIPLVSLNWRISAPVRIFRGGLGALQIELFLPRPSSLHLGIEISGKTMGARGLMGMR
jgi:hypothetical protein